MLIFDIVLLRHTLCVMWQIHLTLTNRSSAVWNYRSGIGYPSDPSNGFQQDPSNNSQQQEEDKPSKFEKGSLRDIDATLGSFATEYSSAHGLPNIYLATTIFGRLFWTLIFLGALAGYIYTMQRLLRSYADFNVATEVRILIKQQRQKSVLY